MPSQPEYYGAMRRFPAILLVFLFSFSPIAPALFVDSESNLPACCRRDGKHHCGMTDMAQTPPTGPSADTLRARCPFFPHGGAVVPNPEAAMPDASQSAGISIVSQTASPAQADVGYRISFDSSHRKRGPPTLFS